MRKLLLFVFLAALVLTACSTTSPSTAPTTQLAATTSASLSSTPTTTPSPIPTYTRQPATATITPSPTVPIPRDRPMIAYQSSSTGTPLILLDPADGASYTFEFPADTIFATPFLDGLSPDARYFVYFQGGTINEYDFLDASPPDFGMRVLDLDSREVIFSMPLLNLDFPRDLEPIVAMTEDQYWMVQSDHEAKLADMNYTMQRTVLDHLRTAAWAPDGSLLAFASQDPGPYSDMYFFEPSERKAWKVTDEMAHVYDLTWAPDSATIALETTLYERHMHPVTTDLLTREGSLLASVEEPYFYGWLDPATILLLRESDYSDPGFNLEALSIMDGTRTPVWEGSFDYFAVAPDLSSVLVGSTQPTVPGQSPGLYLQMLDAETSHQLSESCCWKTAYWGSPRFTYAASAPDTGIFDVPQTGGTYGVSQSGELNLIDEGNWYLLPSPHGELLAAYGPYDSIKGLRIFDGEGALLAALSDERVTCLQWKADSSRLAYQIEDRLYLWEVGDESARQVADHLQTELDWWECAFHWTNEGL
jgi:hypothetical protein